MEKVDPKDQAVRHAIWESYKHKCFYCYEHISIQSMELSFTLQLAFLICEFLRVISEFPSIPSDIVLNSA